MFDFSPQQPTPMERALDRLSETVAHLALERNAPRQQPIVEELFVIVRPPVGRSPMRGDGRM